MGRDVEKQVTETICDRFILAQEVSGMNKTKFAHAVGLTSSQLSNIACYRNPPSHTAIKKAVELLGLSVDWIYGGAIPGLQNPEALGRIMAAQKRRRGHQQAPSP